MVTQHVQNGINSRAGKNFITFTTWMEHFLLLRLDHSFCFCSSCPASIVPSRHPTEGRHAASEWRCGFTKGTSKRELGPTLPYTSKSPQRNDRFGSVNRLLLWMGTIFIILCRTKKVCILKFSDLKFLNNLQVLGLQSFQSQTWSYYHEPL